VERTVSQAVQPLLRRIAGLEAQVCHLQLALSRESSKSGALTSERIRDCSALEKLSCPRMEKGFATLSDEAFIQVLSFLPLRSPFFLKQCSPQLHSDIESRRGLTWHCISDFVNTRMLEDITDIAARSLFRWTSRIGREVAEVRCKDDMNDYDDCLSSVDGVVYEIELPGNVALSLSSSCLARGLFGNYIGECIQERLCLGENLQDAECRLCKRTGRSWGSEPGDSGDTNTYEAEFLLPCASGLNNRLRLGINVTKYFCKGSCGWDESLDVLCLVDGQCLLSIHRDGSDSEYDTQSLNKGILDQLAMQLLVPMAETPSILILVWQILCAPLLACARWDEGKDRFGLGLPHRQDDPVLFFSLGMMFIDLASVARDTRQGWTESSFRNAAHLPRLQKFLDYVQGR